MAGTPRNAQLAARNAPSHQERVNMEMFKAIELLGRKLDRAEGERERLLRRLGNIESAATVDEKTGKLYLPVAAGQAQPPQVIERIERRAPAWQGAASVMSSVIALCALGLVFFREPAPQQQLTQRQLAALDALVHSQFATLETNAWKPIGADTEADFNDIDVRRFTRTDEAPAAPVQGPETDLTRMADSGYTPTVEELAAIEPASGEVTPDEIAAVPAEPAPAVQVAAAPPPAKPAEKPLPKPASTSAPIPLTQPVTQEQPPKKAEPVVAQATAPVVKPQPAALKAEPAPPPAASRALDGVEPDPALPAKLAALEQKAFDGVAEAQHDIATIYAAGKIVAQDFKRAVFWFSKASERGIANADYNLGVMFQQGMGVRKDVNKALGWYEKAASLGHPEAMYNLGIAYIEGIGTARNISRGVTFFKQAANAGVAQAAYNLGVLYESNFIGPIDLSRAAEWYQVAANEGHQEARDAIHRLKGDIGRADGVEDTAAINDQGLTLATAIEPASGGEEAEGYGEGDETPLDEQGRALAPTFGDDAVRQIQQALVARGELPRGSASGYMTPQTEDAIRNWQKKLGWDVDGKPTYELLEKISSAK